MKIEFWVEVIEFENAYQSVLIAMLGTNLE